MTTQLAGQLDLLDLLAEGVGDELRKPFYACPCGDRIDCDAPAAELYSSQDEHRRHIEEFQAAQWPGGRENHPNGKYYGPLLTIDGENLAATLTTKAPHPVNLGMRYACPCCLTNWGELKPEVQERHRAEHEEVAPGICRHMVWIEGKLDALRSGEWETTIAWTEESKALHLTNVTSSRDTTWAHYEGRPTPWATGNHSQRKEVT
ncbi:hypothetical protein [Arthrobacter luteolus]|uniref:hypothetical protein n=1 Tax=Arthrobacter luteolus TaxID=98672 RepID=UPI000829EE79|nr:hypothetical protein [Arthrobacter luteolus]